MIFRILLCAFVFMVLWCIYCVAMAIYCLGRYHQLRANSTQDDDPSEAWKRADDYKPNAHQIEMFKDLRPKRVVRASRSRPRINPQMTDYYLEAEFCVKDKLK